MMYHDVVLLGRGGATFFVKCDLYVIGPSMKQLVLHSLAPLMPRTLQKLLGREPSVPWWGQVFPIMSEDD